MLTKNDSKIWGLLIKEIKNPYGVAGLMGNLYAESSLNPSCCTGKLSNDWNQYISDVDNGTISCEEFSRDGVAFGLAQWRYWSRKEQLYLYAKSVNKSISDFEMQISFLLQEIKTYKTVWNTLLTARTLKEASDIVLEKYERPANISDKIKARRENYSLGYFNTAKADNWTIIEPDAEPKKEVPKVVTKIGNVNYRAGNGKEYALLGQTSSAPGETFKWVATSDNGWHAIVVEVNHKPRVAWIMSDFCEVV